MLVLLSVGNGFLMISWENNFLNLYKRMRYYRKLYCCGTKPMSFQGPTFLCPSPRRKVDCGFNRIKASVQNSHSVLEQCPVQHQGSLVCVPHCTPSVHCMWDPHGHGAHGQMQETQHPIKRTPLFRGLYIPKFAWTCNSPTYSSQSMAPKLDWQALFLVSLTHYAWFYIPF